MTSNTNDKLVQSKILENQLYEVLLYKKMKVLAIQERIAERKRSMAIVPKGPPSINDNANQTALNQSKKVVALDYISILLLKYTIIRFGKENYIDRGGI